MKLRSLRRPYIVADLLAVEILGEPLLVAGRIERREVQTVADAAAVARRSPDDGEIDAVRESLPADTIAPSELGAERAGIDVDARRR